MRVPDVREDPRYINIIDSVRSELVIPLMVKGQAIGVLDIQSTQVDYFTRDQQSVLTLMASRLAIAIENARLFERVRSQADTLLVLNEVGREANSILAVEELLRRAAELVKRVIDYQILGILLYDEATNLYRHRLDVKYGQSAQGKLRVTAHEGIVGAAIATEQPVRVPDVTLDPRYIMVNPETRSELAIPMIHQGRVVGVLDLESPQINYFTEDHEQTLMILAAHLAVSLENARLYEKLARDEARMERELTAAQRLQTALAASRARHRFWTRHHRANSFRARSLRRFVRFSFLWNAAVGHRAGRRQREGKRRGALWRGGHRNSAQPLSAQAPARRASAHSSISWCATAAWKAAT